jgi:hypothetical protein
MILCALSRRSEEFSANWPKLPKTPFYMHFAADLRSSLGRITSRQRELQAAMLGGGESQVRFHARPLVCTMMSAALVATACLSQTVTDQTQTPSLLLPQLMHVRGQVVGETGEPIPKVRLNHLNRSDDIVTDSNGEFDFNTLAPRFVAQRPGFQSALVQTSESARLQLVLHKSPSGPSFPVCSDPKLSGRAPGWGESFKSQSRK